jgi:hypothetical protein
VVLDIVCFLSRVLWTVARAGGFVLQRCIS